ncbi:MAG: type IX secretion system sortase PorU [Bacteroidota bacterium]|nr:type IX secretion system sortase PorU [Bacteroidota bacterium]
MQLLKKLRNIKYILFSLIWGLSLVNFAAFAQQNGSSQSIQWTQNPRPNNLFSEQTFFSGEPALPAYQGVLKLNQNSVQDVKIVIESEKNYDLTANFSAEKLKSSYQINYYVAIERGEFKLLYQIVPLKKIGSAIQKLEKFSLDITYGINQNAINLNKKQTYASQSLLATGDWIKIGTTQNGVYRIDYVTLRNLGINPDNIDPRNLKLYGHGAGMLPQANSSARIDDLKEIAIRIQGENDGRFNPGDFLLFYGESQINQWQYNPNTQNYSFQSNLYSDTTYYFLTYANSPGLRISTTPSLTGENATVNSYTHLQFYNNERTNLTKSGKVWVGEEFDRVTQQNFNVSIPNLILSEPIKLRSSVTARSFVSSAFELKVNGQNILTQNMNPVIPGYEQAFTSGLNVSQTTFTSNSANFILNYTYNKPSSGSVGWLDFYEIQAKSELRNLGGNFIFKDATNMGTGKITKYEIGSNRNLTVLDVTDPLRPIQIEGTFANNIYSFTYATDSLKTFAVYDGSNFIQATNFGKMANQNLHGLPAADGFIISHPAFLAESNRLAKHHKEKDNLNIHVINIHDIYNEFSSGSQDLCAIRDFLRMFYKRAANPADAPKYVALFGRASYDYKYRSNPNSNFIPTFQSWESFSPTSSYCSDDFLGFLDDNEGRWDIGSNLNELLDIGIGRIPVSNATEAAQMVDKFISYTEAESFGPWRNKLVFTADDEDGSVHQGQADNLANDLLSKYPEYNIDKIYLDAYRRESTAGGARFPDAQKAFNNAVQNGCLIFNYTGHGGEVGLTAERVMGIDDINKWTNGLKENGVRLPLFLTATCEFSRFDDPFRVSAGELVLLNPIGGGIALFTTVRLVYSGQNEALNRKFYEQVGFDSVSQLNPPRLGDVARRSKNAYLDVNTRNFTLLGDPILMLAYGKHNIKTTQINEVPLAQFQDTLKALKKFEIKGIVTNSNGQTMNNFNGIIYPIVFDKFASYRTLGNTQSSPPMSFSMQNNVLYRGKATVTNGNFTFSFVVPKDIAYEYGFGKISYYAHDATVDANGYTNTILIGGTADSAEVDNKGPDIKLFLNDDKFINGGITNENPKLIARLFDENGINTTGRGIGRDLIYVLNNNQTQAVIVNDFYQATLNSYQSGEVNVPIAGLPVGKHQLKFRAYDVYNNVSEASLDFEVKSAAKPSIERLLNYPNPFNNLTTFHFDHNLNGQDMQVMIQIFTVNGKLVKSLLAQQRGEGTHFDQLTWDGKDDYGDKLANGVYIYKCKVSATGNKTAEKIEKLVILN